MNTTDTLIDWALHTPGGLPDEVGTRVRLALLDTLGVQLAGANAGGARELLDLVTYWGGRPEATVFATGQRVPLHLAALANATCARVWDLDDVLEHAFCHVSASVVPVALAVAESVGGEVSGPSLVDALAVGMEAVCRLALAPRLTFTTTGASRTYECGTFGATLAAARLLGLSHERTRHAMGIALGMLCGKQQGYLAGTHMVGIGQGMSAHAGALAVTLAGRGITGASPLVDVLEGRFGYYFTTHRGEYDPEVITSGLGSTWHLLSTSVKPLYPCCKFAHTSIAATCEAMRELGATFQRIDRIEVTVTDREAYDLTCAPGPDRCRPDSQAAAQFSMPYILAAAAVHGRVGLEQFTPDALRDERVLELATRVDIRAELDDAAAGRRGALPMPGQVTVALRDGTRVTRHVTVTPGHPTAPMSASDITEKFLACAEFALPDWPGALTVADAALALDRADSVRPLLDALAAGH
ncbi:MmgE/PrpD family protein [Pseudonocardia acaciae]|uniref:MmgE/PrpD family protein n=1 Tax=Pseudonocardia acaciae TaxID=551276 RepID=UPI00048BF2B1|nr:MmgE/PrpD family protein [Pseudonocardia acaciae]